MKKKNIKRIFTSFPFIFGVFVIIYAGIGVVYYQKQTQYQELQPQIERDNLLLQKPRTDLKALEDKLTQVAEQLKKEQASLPKSAQGIEIIDALIGVAQASNVEVTDLKGAPPIEQQDNVLGVIILPLIITVQGTQNDILTFTAKLAGNTELLKTSEVRSVNVEYLPPDNQSASDSNSSEGQYTTMVELYIYAQPKASS